VGFTNRSGEICLQTRNLGCMGSLSLGELS
jgi:hypothetical protein